MLHPPSGPRLRPAFRRQAIPYLVLVVCLLASAVASYFVGQTARAQERTRFENAVRAAREAVLTRLDTYVALLRAGAGLFAASGDVRLDEFRAFVDRLNLRGRYPGIQGIGFTTRFAAHELPALVASMRAQGVFDFHVWPGEPRPEYHAIVFLEPQDRRNAAAIGYDMFTDETRRAAMEQAVRSGAAAASGRVTLVQEIEGEKQPGFLIYLPVFRQGLPLATAADRFVALRGFVYGPFRAGDLLSNIFPPDAEREIDVQVFDLVRGRPDALLFDSRGPDAVRDARFEISFRVEVADRPWWIVVSSRPALEDSPHRSFLAWTIIGGLALSLTLFALMRLEVRARDVAEQATGSLQQSQAALRASARELERVVAAERDAHAEAAEANRVKDEFLATLSHELRTPLNAILGWASMLREKRLDPVQQARALEVIERNARSQAELVDDLLEVSRIITGKLRLELRGIDLEPAVAAAVDAVKPMAEARGVALHWQPQTRGRVLGDPDRMQQVAWNLLSNAIKFTPRGGSVTADVIERDGFVELVVSDAGVGIAPEFLPHVFERFRQADSSTKRGHGGLGLGLAIVRHLVEAHGGGVHAHSDGENRGATFTVRLPAYHGARDRSAATEAAPLAATGSSPGLSAARVLVVDDEPDARDLVGAIVRESGGRAVAVSSVGEALGALHANRFDLIIADIGMPGRDGLDFIREVRSLPPEAGGTIPALALTAYGRPEDRRRAIDAGYQAHLVKPARPEDIVAAAESLLKGR